MSDAPKRPRGRPKKARITTSFEPLTNTDTTLERLHQSLFNSGMEKSVRPVTIRKDLDGKFAQSKIIFSRQDTLRQNTDTKGWNRATDGDLRELSRVDPYISAIISTRVSQAVTVGRPSNSKFDKGTRVLELKPLKLSDFKNDKQAFKNAQAEQANKMEAILEWFQNCGTNNIDVLNVIYKINPDPTFKRCTMSDYIGAQVRNLLTFGRCARYNTRDEDGMIVAFRPAAVETIMPWNDKDDIHMGRGDNTQLESIKDAAEYNSLPKERRPIAFVQRIDGNEDNFFTDEDMVLSYFQKQALFDLNGFPMAPIEMAMYMVYVHQQTLNYLRNQYVKGIGAKGMLVVSSTDPTAQLSQEDLDELKSNFHNYISRNDNSASTPVIAGPLAVNYVSLSPTPRDMEFLNLEEHIVRSLCSAMQISPQEMGYGNLSQGQGGLQQANKQTEMTQGEERGLRMLLDIVYDDLNQVLIEHFPEAKDKFRLSYTGVGEDTKDSVVQRTLAEMQTTATMASMFADSEKNVPIPFGGDVPLSTTFHANILKYAKYGRVMEDFFGEEGAADKPEYDFIIDPNLNQSYQQLKANPINKQAQQTDLQLQGMSIQNQVGAQQLQAGQQQMEQPQEEPQQEGDSQPDQLAMNDDQRQQEAHDQEMRHKEEQHQASLRPQEDAEMDKSEDKDGPKSISDVLKEKEQGKAPKTLAEAFSEQKALKKSINYYFKNWIDSNN